MLTLLTGDNDFEIERAQKKIVASFDGAVERIDGSELEIAQLPDLLAGATLFATHRLVVIKNLSENKSVWNNLDSWVLRISDDTHLVLVETKPDKRTKTYKNLQKSASIRELKAWTDRDTLQTEQWVIKEAKMVGFELDKQSAHALVARLGVDQWSLVQALEKLAVVDVVSPHIIEELIDAAPTESVFNLFEAAFEGNAPKIKRMIQILQVTEDPYRLFGLLSGQAFQLATLAAADKPSIEVAKALGAHPFALSKLAPYAKRVGKSGAKKVVAVFAEADDGMKISIADPWLLIERALIKVTDI